MSGYRWCAAAGKSGGGKDNGWIKSIIGNRKGEKFTEIKNIRKKKGILEQDFFTAKEKEMQKGLLVSEIKEMQ